MNLTPYETLKAYVDPFLEKHRRGIMTNGDVDLKTPVREVLHQTRHTEWGKLLIEEGGQLAMPANGYYGNYDFPANDENLWIATIQCWAWDQEEDKGDDWGAREIDLRFWYLFRKTTQVSMSLKLYLSSPNYGFLCRDVSASVYAETGYEGHNQEGYTPSDEDAIRFIEYVTRLT